MRALLLGIAMILSSTVQAEFISADWKVAGDARAAIDTETGLEWLRLTETDGASIDQVSGLLSTDYQGFRVATKSEVNDMLMTLIPGTYNEGYTQKQWNYKNTTIYNPFASVFGWTQSYSKTSYPPSHDYRSYGLYVVDGADMSNLANSDILLTGVKWTDTPKPGQNHIRIRKTELYDDHSRSDYSGSYSDTNRGVFLVSDSGVTLTSQLNAINNVSAPALGALTLSMLALGYRRKGI